MFSNWKIEYILTGTLFLELSVIIIHFYSFFRFDRFDYCFSIKNEILAKRFFFLIQRQTFRFKYQTIKPRVNF